VIPASTHDSQLLEALLDKDNSRKAIWADSAYRSKKISDKLIRCVGLTRASYKIGMRNLTYNMCRYTQLLRLKTA